MTLQEHVKRITAPYMNRPGNDLNSSWSRMAALTCRPWQWFPVGRPDVDVEAVGVGRR